MFYILDLQAEVKSDEAAIAKLHVPSAVSRPGFERLKRVDSGRRPGVQRSCLFLKMPWHNTAILTLTIQHTETC